ncbi:hypothetical protein [Microbacterium sp. TNHR37B]|uniref:hypothetical protein n=1 Tax=Microbacterium sp. TNHR37B TaxID=1775956 RepID=UPI0007B31886|nr:hypothetical protein [Microbacterium sp. TNHR37B]KZE91367.1 hypothetical protein AVP41_00907 [Microbacterium sp. TNHR37B]
MVCVEVFAAVATEARLVSEDGTQWYTSRPGWEESAVGAYAEQLAVNLLYRRSSVSFLTGVIDGGQVAFRVTETRDLDHCIVEEVDPSVVPDVRRPDDRTNQAWDRAMQELAPIGFVPEWGPVMLSHLGDFCADVAGSAERGRGVRRTTTVVRGRSAFPFHEFEALTASPTLARADAVDAVRGVRGELETCGLIFAERWARMIHIDMAEETAFVPDPSPVGGMTFSPQAHELGDWLELSVAELAEGRGNLVVLGKRFAHDTALIEDPHDEGALLSAHPVTENPWILWLVSGGVLFRFQLLTSPVSERDESRRLTGNYT